MNDSLNNPYGVNLSESEINRALNDPCLDSRLRPFSEKAGKKDISENETLIAFVTLSRDPVSQTLSRSFIVRGEKNNEVVGFDTDIAKLSESISRRGMKQRVKFLTDQEIAGSDFNPKESMDAFTNDEKTDFLAA